MKKRCRFCGEQIDSSDTVCPNCNKPLASGARAANEKASGVSNLDSWQQKSVPAWVMYLATGAALFCIWIMYSQGCSGENPANEFPPNQHEQSDAN